MEGSWKEHYPWLMGNSTAVLGTEEEFLLKKDPRFWESLAGSRGMSRMGGTGVGMSCRTQQDHPPYTPSPWAAREELEMPLQSPFSLLTLTDHCPAAQSSPAASLGYHLTALCPTAHCPLPPQLCCAA